MIKSTYITQALALFFGTLSGILTGITISQGNYLWALLNIGMVGVNISTFLSAAKTRKRLTHGFTKTAQCSCGACDWGTLTRQYDEVPICRNCWTTWKGK